MQTTWSIRLVRMLFVTLAVLLGAAIAQGYKQPLWIGTLLGGLAGFFFVVVDALLAKFTFRDFSFGVFGLLINRFVRDRESQIGAGVVPGHRADRMLGDQILAGCLGRVELWSAFDPARAAGVQEVGPARHLAVKAATREHVDQLTQAPLVFRANLSRDGVVVKRRGGCLLSPRCTARISLWSAATAVTCPSRNFPSSRATE